MGPRRKWGTQGIPRSLHCPRYRQTNWGRAGNESRMESTGSLHYSRYHQRIWGRGESESRTEPGTEEQEHAGAKGAKPGPAVRQPREALDPRTPPLGRSHPREDRQGNRTPQHAHGSASACNAAEGPRREEEGERRKTRTRKRAQGPRQWLIACAKGRGYKVPRAATGAK